MLHMVCHRLEQLVKSKWRRCRSRLHSLFVYNRFHDELINLFPLCLFSHSTVDNDKAYWLHFPLIVTTYCFFDTLLRVPRKSSERWYFEVDVIIYAWASFFWFLVERQHQTALSNARNNNESDLKWRTGKHVIETQNLKRSHSNELEHLRKTYEKMLADKEREFTKTVKDYQERDTAWQEEKQVTKYLGSKHI